MRKVILTADSTCDLTKELCSRFNVQAYIPLHIVLGEKSYEDGVNINPPDIYKNFEATGVLPKTAAVNVGEYSDFFKRFTDEGNSVVHICLGSALSSSYQNAVTAASELENVYPIDSCNLSSGSGHLVIEAAKLIEQGLDAKTVAEKVKGMTSKVQASFVIQTLEYLHKGGRCSGLLRFGATILRIKPQIIVSDGKMAPVKISDSFKAEGTGETWYYSEEDTPKFYVVKGSVANHNAAVASANRFAAGQLMGTYTPSFTFDEETCTVTTVLKETETHAGTAYSVRIDMMNKEQNDVETVDPALSQNYYVLATLTPKGTGSKGQVVAWTVLDVKKHDYSKNLNFIVLWNQNTVVQDFEKLISSFI